MVLNANDSPEIFVVSAVTFDQGKADPFGFDELTEKVGESYVPLAGAVSRVRYFVFIPFADAVVQELKVGIREKRIVRRRLEKLFVYLAYHKYGLGRNSGLIGNSIADANNPFDPSVGTWVQNDCFKIYTNNSVYALGTRDEKFLSMLKLFTLKPKHIAFVKTFLSRQGPPNKHRNWLEAQRAAYSGSVFDYGKPLPAKFYIHFLKNLRVSSKVKKLSVHYPELFKKPSQNIAKIKKDRTHFPFSDLNEFLASAVKAVNADIEGNTDSSLWSKAFENYRKLMQRHGKAIRPVMARISRIEKWRDVQSQKQLMWGLYEASNSNVGEWFAFKNGSSAKGSDFGRIKEQWESLSGRVEARPYSDYRLGALESVILDINDREGL